MADMNVENAPLMNDAQDDTVAVEVKSSVKAVIVKKMSMKAEEKNVRDFFGFCGAIESVEMRENGEEKEAVVVFSEAKSAQTALLLNGAVVLDKAVSVEEYEEGDGDNECKGGDAVDDEFEEKQEKEGKKKEEEKKKSASQVMANVIAEVYVWCGNVADEIHEWWRGTQMSGKTKKAAGVVACEAAAAWKTVCAFCDEIAVKIQNFAAETRNAIDGKKQEKNGREMDVREASRSENIKQD